MPRILISLLVPFVLLIVAFFAAPRAAQLSPSLFAVVTWLPLVIALPMLFLGWRFNRSRLFFATLLITGMYTLITWVLPNLSLSNERYTVQSLSVLVPLYLWFISEVTERGVFSGWGLSRLAIIIAPALIIWGMMPYQSNWLEWFFNLRPLPSDITNWTTFSQPAQIAALIALIVMNGRLFAMPDNQRGVLFGACIGAIIVLHYTGNVYIVSVFSSVVLLMFAAALIQDSWRMAYIDPLTDLPGRRALNDHMMKLRGTFAIAMLDVDHFKKFNDQYGHDIGDEALRMVAGRIKYAGSGGKAYRYGGEEFCIVFPNRTSQEVMESLEVVRKLVEKSPFKPKRKDRRSDKESNKYNTPVKITISIGVAERDEENTNSDAVLKAADKALYRAKKQGRNRVLAS